MTCQHDWIITGVEGPSNTGFMSLACVKCGAWGGIEFERQAEFDFVNMAYEYGFLPLPLPAHDGIDDFWTSRVKVFSNEIESPSLGVSIELNAGDGDDVDSVGTMGWLPSTAGEFDQLANVPAECGHVWHVNGITAAETENVEIELYCLRCHEWATVPDLTDDEAETIGKAWSMGMALEWQNNDRVTLYRDLQRPPAADLVDALDLFGDEDDDGIDYDMPF